MTGIPNYPEGKFYDGYGWFKKRHETYQNINIIRIPIMARRTRSFCLAFNYLSFVVSGWFFAKLTKLQADVVFIYEVSPMTQALPGIWFAKRRAIPCILYVMDLWPDNVEIITKTRSNLFLAYIGRIVNSIYQRCDKILTSSKGFIPSIEKRGIDSVKLEYWPQYAETVYHPVKREESIARGIQNDGRFHIVFAGNIGIAQGLSVLVSAAKILKSKGDAVCFDIIGDGRAKKDLIMQIRQENVTEMFVFIPKQPSHLIPHFFALADAAIITMAKNKVFELTIPAKLQSCMACGIPLLVSADGEVQRIVEEADAGFYCGAEDAIGLSAIIKEMKALSISDRNLLGMNGFEYFRKWFERSKLMDRMDAIITELEV